MPSERAKNKIRILVVDNSVAVTGALKAAVQVSETLTQHFEFFFLLPAKSHGASYLKEKGFPLEELGMIELRKDFFAILQYMPVLILNTFKFFQIVKRNKIDVIHTNDFYNMIPPFYKMLGGNCPYICHIRFMPNRFPSVLTRFWTAAHNRFAFAVIAVSNAVKNTLPRMKKVNVIADGLPLDEKIFLKSKLPHLLYPANFIEGKGHEYALKSFAAIADRFPDWSLKFVGGDMGLDKNVRYKNMLVKTAIDLGLSQQVEWHSFATHIAEEYAACSIVLNFSNSESFSLTCQESLFFGRPVIATDSGGPAEIIDAGETGLLVPVGDVSSMREAMEQLMSDENLREQMGSKGAERMRERFGSEQTSDRLRDIYLTASAVK